MSDVNIVIDKDSLSKKEEEKAAEQRKQQTKDLFEQSIEEALLEKRVFLTSSPAQDLIFILKYYHVGCCLLWNHDNDLYKKSERLVVFACTIIWSMFASIVAHTFDLDIAKGDSAVGWVFLFAFFITFWRFLLLLIATCAQNDFCFDFCGCLPRGLFKNFGTGVLCTLSIGSLLFVLITMSLPQSPDKDLATTQWFYSLLVSLTIYETLIWILWFFIRRPQEEKKFLTPAFTFTNKDENKNNWLKNPFAQITVRKSPVEGAVVLHLETLEGQKKRNEGHESWTSQVFGSSRTAVSRDRGGLQGP